MMKVIIPTIAAAVLLTGCTDKQSAAKIAALEQRVDGLTAEIAGLRAQLAANQAALAAGGGPNETQQIELCKLWVLDHLEAIELREATNRYELKTELQDLIFKTSRASLDAK